LEQRGDLVRGAGAVAGEAHHRPRLAVVEHEVDVTGVEPRQRHGSNVVGATSPAPPRFTSRSGTTRILCSLWPTVDHQPDRDERWNLPIVPSPNLLMDTTV